MVYNCSHCEPVRQNWFQIFRYQLFQHATSRFVGCSIAQPSVVLVFVERFAPIFGFVK